MLLIYTYEERLPVILHTQWSRLLLFLKAGWYCGWDVNSPQRAPVEGLGYNFWEVVTFRGETFERSRSLECALSAVLSVAAPLSSFGFLTAEGEHHTLYWPQILTHPRLGREYQSAWSESSETVGQDHPSPCYIVCVCATVTKHWPAEMALFCLKLEADSTIKWHKAAVFLL